MQNSNLISVRRFSELQGKCANCEVLVTILIKIFTKTLRQHKKFRRLRYDKYLDCKPKEATGPCCRLEWLDILLVVHRNVCQGNAILLSYIYILFIITIGTVSYAYCFILIPTIFDLSGSDMGWSSSNVQISITM